MARISLKELLLSGVALAAAAVSPNLFWLAQAGYSKLSTLAVWVLIPSVIILLAVLAIAAARHERRLVNRMLAGGLAGGPSGWSNIVGWTYHYWNGVCFGLIFAVVFGRKPLWFALGYGVFMAVGFLVSPAVTTLGIGFMGRNMPGMPVTVVLAHLAYAALLGVLTRRWVRDSEWILVRSPVAGT